MTLASLVASVIIAGGPCVSASSIESGERSPCAGVLLPLMDATDSIRCLNVSLPKAESELVKCEGIVGALTTSHKEEVEALNHRIRVGEDALVAMAKCPECERAWWDNPGLAFGAGVVTTTAIVVALLFGTN